MFESRRIGVYLPQTKQARGIVTAHGRLPGRPRQPAERTLHVKSSIEDYATEPRRYIAFYRTPHSFNFATATSAGLWILSVVLLM